MKQSLNTTGYVIKEEKVSNLKGHRMRNTLVLDVNHPFPGYYGQAVVEQSVPGAIIFVTKKQQTWESILRVKKRINNYLDMNVDITKVKVNMRNKTFQGIRAKNFGDFQDIEPFQKALVQEGFAMAKSRTMSNEEDALINLKKFFFLEEKHDHIFQDTKRHEMNYILLDKFVNWEVFRKVTTMVKNNISDSSFDVAKGAFYMDNCIVDMIRIFKPNSSMDLLAEIKDLYEKNIAKYS